MNIFDLFSPNSCNIQGKDNGLETWDQDNYLKNRKELGDKVVLVDMIGQPLPFSVKISNEMFTSGSYPEGTIFVLYCHSGGSSGFLQMKLAKQYPQYKFVNLDGGIMFWNHSKR